MKTNIIKTAIIIGLTFTGLHANASNLSPASPVSPGPEKTISNNFKFPTLLIPFNESQLNAPVKVEVIFTTDKEGNVTYAHAKTRDIKLKQEIEKQFSFFKLASLKENVAHSVVLSFKYTKG
jgi:hypothetical protein